MKKAGGKTTASTGGSSPAGSGNKKPTAAQQGKKNGAPSSSPLKSSGGVGEKHRASKAAVATSPAATAGGKSTPKKRHDNSPAGESPAFPFRPATSSPLHPSPKSHHGAPSPQRSPMPFVFGTSSAASPSSSPSAFTGIKFVPAGSPSASPSRGPSPATSPFSGRGGRGRGRGGYGGGEGGFDGGGRGRGGGTSPYQPKAKAGGYRALGNSGGGGGQYRHHKRERVLGQWSDAVNYDRVKKVINVYLNEFQLKDRDLERFIVWFESADGGRRSLGWLLNMHAKGWDEETADSNDEQTTKSEASAELKKKEKSESDETSTKESKPPGMNWHLQENQITDEGVKLLIAFAKRVDAKVELRRFYLYKNIIGDDGAAAIASFVKESRSFVFEIHLSHNRLTIKGAQELFMATKEARVKPPRPLWLRLEWNYVSFEKAKKFLHDENITYCRVKDRLQCAPSKCARKPPPLLHLYVAELQYSESVGASSHLQMAKAKVKLAKEQVEKQNLAQDPRAFSREKGDSSAAATTSSVPAPAISKTTDAVISEQSKPTVEAISAGERKESAAMSAAARTPSRKPEAPTTTTTPAESKKAVGGSDEDLLRDVPTYIFLDTCAVLRMSEWRKGAKSIESDMAQLKSIAEAEEEEYQDIDSDDEDSDDDDDSEDEDEEMAAEQVMKIVQRKVEKISSYTSKTKKSVVQQQRQQQQKQQARGPIKNARANVGGGARDSTAEFPVFTFENLVERAKKGKFGENLAKPGDQVTLIITDTVMRELDHLKSSKPALIRNILSLQSDDGYLAKGVHLKFVEMLGAHQGEHLVALQDSSIVQSYGRKVMKGTSSLDNDRKIIDVALFWNSEIGVTGNVILLTADEGVREAAKRHNLPSDMWKNLDKRLFNALKRDPSAPWTASLLKSCMPGCMVKRDGKTMHLTPSVKPVQSIFQELDNALVLTYMLMEKMKALQADNRQLKDLIFDDVRSRVGAINAASPDALNGLADLQAVIAQHDEERNGEEDDDDEVDRLVAVTRERRRIWIEVLGQMAGPMSPLRMKSAESIWDGVKATSRRPGSGLSQLMKTAEFLEVDDDDSGNDDDDNADNGERAVYQDDQEDQKVEDQDEEDEEAEAPAINETEAAVEVDSSADSGVEEQDRDSSASGAEAESASSGHEQAAEHTETTLHSTAEVEDEHEAVQEATAADVEDQPAVSQVLAEVAKTDTNEEPEKASEHNSNASAASALPQEASLE